MRALQIMLPLLALHASADTLHVPGQFATIQLAVDAAKPGDEILVAPGTHDGFESFADVAVRGAGAVPGDTVVSGLVVVFDRFVLSNIHLTAGLHSPGFDEILISDCLITGVGVEVLNTASAFVRTRFEACVGGGANILDGTALFEECHFLGNTTAVGGGGISCSDSNVVIVRCIFESNHADGAGGAIGASTFAADLLISDSVFIGNTAANAGAVYSSVQFGQCSITNCAFADNTSTLGAGAVWLQSGSDTEPPGGIADSSFEACVSDDAEGAAVVFALGAIQPLPAIASTSFCGSVPADVVGLYEDAGGNTLVAACPCFADTNGDGTLTPADFSAWIAAFNTGGPACDQNRDTLCTPADFSAWIAGFNAGCH